MLTRRLRPKQNRLRNFSTVPLLYKCNDLQKKRGSFLLFPLGDGLFSKGLVAHDAPQGWHLETLT